MAVPMKCKAQEPKLRVLMNTTRERKRDDDENENENGDIIYGDGDDGRRHLFHVLSVPSSEFRMLHTSNRHFNEKTSHAR